MYTVCQQQINGKFKIQCFGPQYTVLLRVNSYRNDLRGNKNCFELVGGLSYQGFVLPRVKLQLMYEGNPGEINFGSS